ncbi:X-ray repair cross-complementing protein 5 [Anabrus simplex]|uniref:X-ray repair cross-complementing protein 5 n=1 Tax=Anabrus simplex TaxID=316456 RepID=UPI0035A307F2
MARTKEAIVIVLDVGRNVSQEVHQDGKTFLELSKSCIMRIIERKIFSLAKDEIGMVLVGSKESANPLEYHHISEAFVLTLPSWKMLKIVEKDIVGTNEVADWLDGIVIAMNMLKMESEGKKFSAKKIVLFTNCQTNINDSNAEIIMQTLVDEQVELTVIGPDIFSPQIKEEADLMDVDSGVGLSNDGEKSKTPKAKSQVQEYGEALLAQMVEKTDGVFCSFNDALPQLLFYQKKSVRPTAWNVCLDIGPDIQIPVSGFRKIADVPIPSWKDVLKDSPTVPIEKERSYFKKDKTVVEKEDRIEGYTFGSTLVPYSETDKTAMSYKSGNKCLSVLGFTKSSNIPRHLLVGVGVYYFIPQRDKPEVMPAFSAFVHSLQDLGLVAVVRRVYNSGYAPYIGALFPKIKDRKECLVYVELPYSEDIREFIFPSLTTENNKPTQEQLNAVDFLIDNMDLMNVEEDGERVEAFCPKRTLRPYHQHLYRTMAFRALHPKEDLPPVGDEIKKMFKCPFESKIGYKEALEIIKKHFVFVEQKPKNPYRRREKRDENASEPVASTSKVENDDADVVDMNLDDLTKPSIVEVGTVSPEQDFHLLLEKGEPLKELCSQMQKVILSLVLGSFGADNFPKARSALSTLRKTCVEKDPEPYNKWLPDFKESLLERGKDVFWELVAKDELGLITSEENPESSISSDEAQKLMKIEEYVSQTAQNENIDAEDLFNEM